MEEFIVFNDGNWYRHSKLTIRNLSRSTEEVTVPFPNICCSCKMVISEPIKYVGNLKEKTTYITPDSDISMTPICNTYTIYVIHCGEISCHQKAKNLVDDFKINLRKYMIFPYCEKCLKILITNREKCDKCQNGYYCSVECRKSDLSEHSK